MNKNITYIIEAKDAFSKTLKKFNDLIDKSQRQIKNFKSSVDNLSTQSFKKLEKAATNVNSSVNKMNSTLKKSKLNFKDFGKSLEGIGWGATKKISIPLATTAFFGIKNVASIEKHLKAVQANASLTTKDYEELLKLKTELSKKTGITPLKISEGLEVLSASGIHTVKELKDIIEPALNLSRSSNSELEETSRLLNEVMHAYHMGSSEASTIADKMSYAMDAAGLRMHDLIYSMQYVAPNAHQAGLSLDELTAFIMTFARSGKKGSVAATGLNSLIGSIGKNPDIFRKMYKGLGIEAVDANGRILDSVKLLEGMKAMFSSAEKQGKFPELMKALKLTVQEKDAYVALISLFDDFKKDLKSVSKQQDFAAKNAITKTDTLIGSYEKMGATIARINEKLFDREFMESIRKIFDSLEKGLLKIENKSPAFYKLIRVIATIAIVFGPALYVIGKFVVVMSLLSTLIGGGAIVSSFLAISGAVAFLTAAIAAAIYPAMKLLNILKQIKDTPGGIKTWIVDLKNQALDTESWKNLGAYFKENIKQKGLHLMKSASAFVGENVWRKENDINLKVSLDPNLKVNQTKENTENVNLSVSKNTGELGMYGLPSY